MNARRARWVALLLLLLLHAQLAGVAVQLSATVDEAFHITSGYEYLRTGRLRLFDEHTPVAKALFAWPLFFVPDLPPPEAAADYADGDLIAVTQNTLLAYRPLDRVIVAPRLAATLLAVLLAAALYRCGKSCAGPTAGLLALTLCAFDPNFLAHGSLATTDMGATAFIFWAIWAGTRWLEKPTARRWWIAALLLGLAQGAKLTALLVYPVLGLGVLFNVEARRRKGAEWKKLLGAFAEMVGASLLVLWALYGFEVRPIAGAFGGFPLPAASHIERWLRLQENLAYGREAFLLGQNAMHGWRLYFPVAFLVKTPLPLLLLSLWGLARTAYCALRKLLQNDASRITHHALRITHYASRITFFLFPLLYAAASLTSRLNIGYRHLLPVLPCLYVAVGIGGSRKYEVGSKKTRSRKMIPTRHPSLLLTAILLTPLLVWLILGALRIAPHYLAFFNEIAGGADNGWRFLADSNTDWGQNFKTLAAYQQQRELGPVRLSAFTFYDPAAYGVDYTPLAPMTGAPPVLPRRFNPEAGIYAISATTLDGVPLPYPSTFDWFRHREPFEKIGNALFLYDVQPVPGTWIAQCNTPVTPLPDAAIDEGFGIPNLRRIAFDCEQSWVLPGGGATPGWFALAIPEQMQLRWPTGDARRADLLPAWIPSVDDLRLSYLQPRHGELPAFAIWECAPCAFAALQPPVELGTTLRFLGLSAPDTAKPGATVDVVTFWEVLAPSTEPLSIMLHLRDRDGLPIAVGDGLGFPAEQWQAGDRFAQRHRIVVPPESVPGDYWLYTGAYWLDTLQPLISVQPLPPISIGVKP